MPQERQEKRIDELPVLSEVTGTEELPISDNGVAKRVTVETLLSKAVGGDSITVTQDTDGFYINVISADGSGSTEYSAWTGGSY